MAARVQVVSVSELVQSCPKSSFLGFGQERTRKDNLGQEDSDRKPWKMALMTGNGNGKTAGGSFNRDLRADGQSWRGKGRAENKPGRIAAGCPSRPQWLEGTDQELWK